MQNYKSDAEMIKSYVDICNRALKLNRNRFPFKQILGAAKQAERGNIVEVEITDGGRETFVFEIRNDLITVKPHGECKNCQCSRKWTVSKSYINDVVNTPDLYISNPARINWEWMFVDSDQTEH